MNESIPPPTSLWRSPDFLKFWAGQAISELGSEVSRFALPLVAVVLLQATPAQMGLLSAAGSVAAAAVGLFAGAWADRTLRKPLMIWADLGRMLALGLIPLAALGGFLNLPLLFAVTILVSILSVVFEVAYNAYFPGLVERRHILEGNSKLAASESLAEIAGTSLAGALVQALGAPLAVLADAVSFLASIFSLSAIRKPEAPPEPVETGGSLRAEIHEGLREVWRRPALRRLSGAIATLAFFGNFIGVLYSLYAIRDLGLGAFALSLTIAAGGVGSFAGAALAPRLSRAGSLRRGMVLCLAGMAAMNVLIPLAGGPLPLRIAILVVSQLIGDTFRTVFFIQATSIRQTVAGERLLGRVSASMDLIVSAVSPVGALLGGVLAELAGARLTLGIAAAGGLLASLWLAGLRTEDVPEL